MATSNPNQNSITDEYIRDLLECPVCMETIKSVPVYQCANGHVICKDCIEKLNNCPICRNDSELRRNLKLENIVQRLEGILPENDGPATAKPNLQKWGKGSVRVYGTINRPNQEPLIESYELFETPTRHAVIHQSAVRQPSLRQLSIRQPSVSQPIVRQSSIRQPLVRQPSTRQPSVSQPSVNCLTYVRQLFDWGWLFDGLCGNPDEEAALLNIEGAENRPRQTFIKFFQNVCRVILTLFVICVVSLLCFGFVLCIILLLAFLSKYDTHHSKIPKDG